MNKIQLNINATSLRYSHCLLSWFRTIHQGWVEPRFSDKIVYGIAVHKYLDTMYKTGDMGLARDNALKVFRVPKIESPKALYLSDEKHMIYVGFDAWNNYAATDSTFDILQMPDGKPATEVTFSIPFYEDDIVQVNIVGTEDKIGTIRNGCHAIGDWKTTSHWDPVSYLEGYRMSHQLRFYVLSLKIMHRHFPDSVLGKIGGTRVGAFIDAIFLKDKASEMSIKRSTVFQFSNEDLYSFEQSLIRRIKQLSQAIGDGTVMLKEGIVNNTCELKYNKCPYYAVCATQNPDIENLLLLKNFDKRPYDPLARDKGI